MRGTGYGHGGPVGEILAALPLDSTFHVADCGYDDNGGRCGCYDLPAKLQRIIDAARSEALREAADAALHEDRDIDECIWWSEQLRGRADMSTSPASEVRHGE